MARLGFAPGAALAPALLSNPVGWVVFGASVALSFVRWGAPRGNYQKFDREIFPTLKSLTDATGLETMTGWFNELVGVDQFGNRKVYGSWEGMGPEWGNLAAARVMELGREGFLWSFQPGRSEPWVIIGPHSTLGSVVYISLASVEWAIDWWNREREEMLRQWEESQTPPDPIEPTQEAIDPGEVSAPPETDPATGQSKIDPPAAPPAIPPPKPKPWWATAITVGAGILSAILGGKKSGYGGYGGYGGNGYGAGGLLGGMSQNDWLLLGAAGLLLLASGKKKRKKHAETKR